MSTNPATWDQWYGFQRWRSVAGALTRIGTDTEGDCSAAGAQAGGQFPAGWSGDNFAQMNPDVTDACDQRDKLVQAVSGAGLNGLQLELSFLYINDNPQTSTLLYWVCGLTGSQTVPLFFSGPDCGKSSSGAVTIASGALAESASWSKFSTGPFTVNAAYTAVVVVIELGGRTYPAPGIAAGVDDVYLGPPAIPVVSDSMLRGGDRNTNEGANTILAVSGSGNTRVVLDFGATAGPPVGQVLLLLDIADNVGNWGVAGKYVSVHPLDLAFEEGNGKAYGLPPSAQVRGSGSGVTWNCPVDDNITNSAIDCLDGWAGGEFGPIIDSVLVTNETTGTLVFDITTWYNSNLGEPLRFLVKKDNDGAPGRVDFFSREGGAPPRIQPCVQPCVP